MGFALRLLPMLLLAAGLSQFAVGLWIPAKAALAQTLLEKAWQRTTGVGERVRPWPWADTWPVARLTAPRLGEAWIVLAGSSGRTLAFGPGHTDGSALPGEIGAAIVSGHRDTHFARLRELRVGDEVLVERPDGTRIHYRVDDLRVADSRSDHLRDPGVGRSLVLVTCWPFDALTTGGPLRFVATAHAEHTSMSAAKGSEIRIPHGLHNTSHGTPSPSPSSRVSPHCCR
jgi:sortase A